MHRFLIPASVAAALLLASSLAFADDPGGGTKLRPPVTGEEVYTNVCQACHMANGKGGSGAATIPALADNPRLAGEGYPISMVVRGRGAMPGMTDILSAKQIANVVAYVRTHFGNAYATPVTEAEVAELIGPKHAK